MYKHKNQGSHSVLWGGDSQGLRELPLGRLPSFPFASMQEKIFFQNRQAEQESPHPFPSPAYCLSVCKVERRQEVGVTCHLARVRGTEACGGTTGILGGWS